jgi:methionyl-tRNA synthetase
LFDALVNYVSTLAEEGVESLEDLEKSENFKKYWVNGNPTQYCGKINSFSECYVASYAYGCKSF